MDGELMSFATVETTLSRLAEEFFLSFGCLDIYIRLPSSPEKKGNYQKRREIVLLACVQIVLPE